MSHEVSTADTASDGTTPRKGGLVNGLQLDGTASTETTPRSRTTSAQNDSVSTPTTAAFDRSTTESTPKAVAKPRAMILPEQSVSPEDISDRSGSAGEGFDPQQELSAARAALEDVHLTRANTDPEHYGAHAVAPPSTLASRPPSRPPSITTSTSGQALASSSRGSSPSSARPPAPPRRQSGSQASGSSRRGSSAGPSHDSSRRLSSASSHHASPRFNPEDPTWTPTDVRHSSVAEGGVLETSSLPSSSVRASTSSTTLEVIIRDFAFERSDPRFRGLPHPDEPNDKRNSSSRASRISQDSPAIGNDTFGSSTSSGFSWGFVTSHATDFNTSEDDSQLYSEDDTSSRSDFEYNDPNYLEQALGAFVPGIYSAMYDFTPELETEMAIKTGEIVTVFSRQCAGWVQAARVKDGNVTGEVGLVPENYLSLVEESEFTSQDWNDETPLAEEGADSYEAAGNAALEGAVQQQQQKENDGERRRSVVKGEQGRTEGSDATTDPPPDKS